MGIRFSDVVKAAIAWEVGKYVAHRAPEAAIKGCLLVLAILLVFVVEVLWRP